MSLNHPSALVRIENNHFSCQCDKMSWFLGAMTKNFDTDVIANGRGSLQFLRFFKTLEVNKLKLQKISKNYRR